MLLEDNQTSCSWEANNTDDWQNPAFWLIICKIPFVIFLNGLCFNLHHHPSMGSGIFDAKRDCWGISAAPVNKNCGNDCDSNSNVIQNHFYLFNQNIRLPLKMLFFFSRKLTRRSSHYLHGALYLYTVWKMETEISFNKQSGNVHNTM